MQMCSSCKTENPVDFKFCENCGEPLNQIACPACSHLNQDDMKFCEECGTRLDVLVCPACSHENPMDFKFCEECGQTLVEPAQQAVLKTEPPRPKPSKPVDVQTVQAAPVKKTRRASKPAPISATVGQKRPLPQPTPQQAAIATPKPNNFKMIMSVVFKVVLRFVLSSGAGYALGKAFFLIMDLLQSRL